MTPAIYPGLRISGPAGHGACRLGLVVRHQDGRTLGLSARHVLYYDVRPEIFDLDTNRQIGSRIEWPHSEAGSNKFFETIAAFELENATNACTNRLGDKAIIETAPLEGLVGRHVMKLDGGSDFAVGEITAVGGSVRFTDPYLRTTEVLRGAIEVRFRRGGRNPTSAQEAGALLIDERYAAVGLLICGDRERAFFAPLQDFMRAHKLSLPAIAQAAPSHDIIAKVENDLEQASLGSEQLLRDLRAEGPVHDDPGSEVVPDQLTERLRRA